MNTPSRHGPFWRSSLMVASLLLFATLGGFFLDHHVSLTSQAMLYVLAVVLASYRLPWVPSVVCAVGAVTTFNFFFVPPRWTFAVDSRENLIALGTMLLVALVISHLTTALRRETALARLNESRARRLQNLATDLATASSPTQVLDLGRTALCQAFAGPVHVAAVGANGRVDLDAEVDSMVVDGMHCCMREAAVLGPGTGRWPGLNAWYLPLGSKGQMHGAVCIGQVAANDSTGREYAQALCALLSQTLWRLGLSAAMQLAQAQAQRQQVQSTFLAAISHDLRTPLAAVVGAASALQTQKDKLAPAEQERLLGTIVHEASYLSNVTENTLQLVQLSNAAQTVQHDWQSMEEIVGAVLGRMRERDPTRRIRSKVAEGLPLVRVDPVLIAQLLSNLIDNALKYSADAVDLTVNVDEHSMTIAVKDRGATIPVEMHDTIFQPYSRNDHSGKRGAGLGLALCRAIAALHGGNIVLRPRSAGGNTFALCLPLQAQPPMGELP